MWLQFHKCLPKHLKVFPPLSIHVLDQDPLLPPVFARQPGFLALSLYWFVHKPLNCFSAMSFCQLSVCCCTCNRTQWFKPWQHFDRRQYILWLVIWYFIQPVSLPWGSLKARISHACLCCYWWTTTLERWTIINIWFHKMKVLVPHMTLIPSCTG